MDVHPLHPQGFDALTAIAARDVYAVVDADIDSHADLDRNVISHRYAWQLHATACIESFVLGQPLRITDHGRARLALPPIEGA